MTKFSKKIYDTSTIKIENLEILILRKAVRKIYLRIATNDGKIHLIAPRKTSRHYLKSLLIDKLPWIKKHYQKFSKNNVNNINFQNGETIDFFGNKYILEIILNQEKQIIQECLPDSHFTSLSQLFDDKSVDLQDKAINIVSSWYIKSEQLEAMSKEQKIQLIWKNQIE